MDPTVSIERCRDYEPDQVARAVHRLLDTLGGITRFVQKGQTVLLKPNMLSAKDPNRGITTHPTVLEAMVREVQSAGGNVLIGDSPSGVLQGVKRCWENTGFLRVAEKTGSKLVNFEADGSVLLERNGRKYHIARAVMESDVVINLPKFKTHGFTLYTGAIKNLYGTLPGFQKARFHKALPHPDKFSQIPVDLYHLIRPALHLMDGILGMEGNGPATGKLRDVGLLLASTDGVALDAVASALMGFRPGEIDAIRLASLESLGEVRLDRIRIIPEPLEQYRLSEFHLPSNRLMKFVPLFLVNWVGKFLWVRPRSDYDKCTGCAVCATGCPVQAIQMVDGKPVMDYHLCINCLCCNESCPENAIYQELSWLAKQFS
jgi:uncharacterized protein (DUF362 family)/Pyruvate/2-oxoacid:ferredoxin oxidoreductase delta subunit